MSGETVSLSIPLPFVLQQWTRRWWLPTTTSVKTFPRPIFSPPALGLSHLWLFSTLFMAGPCPSAACGCPQIHGAADVVVGAPAGHGFAGVPPKKKKNQRKSDFGRKKKNHKKMVFLRDMWSGTALGPAWFSRPFAPETRQKSVFSPKTREKQEQPVTRQDAFMWVYVSCSSQRPLFPSGTTRVAPDLHLGEKKYREFISFPRGEILMLRGKSRAQAYV